MKLIDASRVKRTARKKQQYEGNEFVVPREAFDPYFAKPLPRATFYELVEKGTIVPFKLIKGRFLLNASLFNMGLPTVASLPGSQKSRTQEDIVRLAFTLLDPQLFPMPPWAMTEEGWNCSELEQAQAHADLYRDHLKAEGSYVLKLAIGAGAFDAAAAIDRGEVTFAK